MTSERKSLVLPIMLITVGIGWLLTTIGVAPGVNWVWTLGLAIVGVLTIVGAGFDKVTFVVGAFLVVTSLLSVLRQTDRLSIDVEVPILVIVAGVLLLIARSSAIPFPKWILEEPQSD